MKPVCLGYSKTPTAFVSYTEAMTVLRAFGHQLSDNFLMEMAPRFGDYCGCDKLHYYIKDAAGRLGMHIVTDREWLVGFMKGVFGRNPVQTCAVPPRAVEPPTMGPEECGEWARDRRESAREMGCVAKRPEYPGGPATYRGGHEAVFHGLA